MTYNATEMSGILEGIHPTKWAGWWVLSLLGDDGKKYEVDIHNNAVVAHDYKVGMRVKGKLRESDWEGIWQAWELPPEEPAPSEVPKHEPETDSTQKEALES